MKGAILYYSLNGSTAKFVHDMAEKNGFKSYRFTEKKKRTVFNAFLKGSRQAMKREAVELNPVEINWTGVERIVVACPIWAGYPVPAFNSMIKLLPKKMPIELYFISGSGSSANSRAETEKLLADEGYNIVSYTDVVTRSIYADKVQKK
jgi:hypothetical protein